MTRDQLEEKIEKVDAVLNQLNSEVEAASDPTEEQMTKLSVTRLFKVSLDVLLNMPEMRDNDILTGQHFSDIHRGLEF